MILGHMPGGVLGEGLLHRLFAARRGIGEWFQLEEEELSWLSGLLAQGLDSQRLYIAISERAQQVGNFTQIAPIAEEA